MANNIPGAVVSGSPTKELLIDSYNISNEEKLDYEHSGQFFSSTVINYDLYVPQNTRINGCRGYWLASPSVMGLMVVDYLGEIMVMEHSSQEFSVRPVVALPLHIECSYDNEIFTIKK